MSRSIESCEVVFFLTRGDLVAASGPVGDYLFASAFAASNPGLRTRVIRFNDPSTVITVEPGRLLIGQNGEPPVNLLETPTFVYFPLSFEPETVALRPISETLGDGGDGYDDRQWRVVAGYLESALPRIGRCINSPDSARLAANKLVQMDAARAVGVSVAPSVVTNDADVASAAISAHGTAVRKNLSEGDAQAQLCTAAGGAGPRSASAWLIQPFIEAERELRIYAIGDEFITVQTRRSRAHEPGDDVRVEVADPHDCSISEDYSRFYARLRRYLDVLGLSYAAFDSLPADGDLVVLEVNPNGTWHFLPEQISTVITGAFHGYVAGTL